MSTPFEETSRLMNNRWEWDKAYEKVATPGLSLFREDGVRGELNALRIHEREASFCLSNELIAWNKQALSEARERNK
jgi:hypothetical protein